MVRQSSGWETEQKSPTKPWAESAYCRRESQTTNKHTSNAELLQDSSGGKQEQEGCQVLAKSSQRRWHLSRSLKEVRKNQILFDGRRFQTEVIPSVKSIRLLSCLGKIKEVGEAGPREWGRGDETGAACEARTRRALYDEFRLYKCEKKPLEVFEPESDMHRIRF